MRNQPDFDPNVAELINGVPTAKNQDGQTLEELEKEFEENSSASPLKVAITDNQRLSAFEGFPLC